MKRMTALSATVALLALSVAAPAGAAPGKGPKPASPSPFVTCVVTDNGDGTRTQVCTNSRTGDTETITEINPD